MRLGEYLTREGIPRYRFAEMVGCSKATVGALCKGQQWLGRDLAVRIVEVTGGEVTPNDFLPELEAAE